MANTFANILGGVALMILILWGSLEVKDAYTREAEEERIFKENWDAHIAKQMEEMKKMHKQNDSIKKKSNSKQFDGVKSDIRPDNMVGLMALLRNGKEYDDGLNDW